jgi:SAM-dependent methyltransferase
MSDLYAPARFVTDVKDCQFYHTIDLPGHGAVSGTWDLRRNLDRYLGHVDFRGKRVLDVGAASGFLSFSMEQRGAEVVSYDLPDTLPWDFVPFAGTDQQQVWAGYRRYHWQLNNSYWLGHRLFKSRARLVYGSVYNIPEAIGPVDVSVFGSILLHLRDPFLALQKALQITRHTAVVADVLPRRWFWHAWLGRFVGPKMQFLPRLEGNQYHGTWWVLSARAVQRFLEVLGFEKTRVTYHWQKFEGRNRLFYTVVGQRTRPAPKLCQIDQPPEALAA